MAANLEGYLGRFPIPLLNALEAAEADRDMARRALQRALGGVVRLDDSRVDLAVSLALAEARLRIAIEALEEIDGVLTDALSTSGCPFFACPGPDEPVVQMAICHRCFAHQQLRAVLKAVAPDSTEAPDG